MKDGWKNTSSQIKGKKVWYINKYSVYNTNHTNKFIVVDQMVLKELNKLIVFLIEIEDTAFIKNNI